MSEKDLKGTSVQLPVHWLVASASAAWKPMILHDQVKISWTCQKIKPPKKMCILSINLYTYIYISYNIYRYQLMQRAFTTHTFERKHQDVTAPLVNRTLFFLNFKRALWSPCDWYATHYPRCCHWRDLPAWNSHVVVHGVPSGKLAFVQSGNSQRNDISKIHLTSKSPKLIPSHQVPKNSS